MKKTPYYRDWDEMPVLLTIDQCAVILQVAYQTAFRWVASGALPATKIGSKNWFVAKKDLKELFERTAQKQNFNWKVKNSIVVIGEK